MLHNNKMVMLITWRGYWLKTNGTYNKLNAFILIKKIYCRIEKS